VLCGPTTAENWVTTPVGASTPTSNVTRVSRCSSVIPGWLQRRGTARRWPSSTRLSANCASSTRPSTSRERVSSPCSGIQLHLIVIRPTRPTPTAMGRTRRLWSADNGRSLNPRIPITSQNFNNVVRIRLLVVDRTARIAFKVDKASTTHSVRE